MKSICLVGLMGSGKSTLGRQLLSQLDASFQWLDLDDVIVQQAGKSIPQIFADAGEKIFREMESACLQAALADDALTIMATGGGAILSADNRALMQKKSTVVWLDAKPEVLAQRITGDSNRPLLEGVDALQKMKALSQVRNPLYASIADFMVNTGEVNDQQAVSSIMAFMAE